MGSVPCRNDDDTSLKAMFKREVIKRSAGKQD
jgi:hypothetical protein